MLLYTDGRGSFCFAVKYFLVPFNPMQLVIIQNMLSTTDVLIVSVHTSLLEEMKLELRGA